MWIQFLIIGWTLVNVRATSLSTPSLQNLDIDSLIAAARKELNTWDPPDIRRENSQFIQQWQDLILSSVTAVNHLNCLSALASQPDFALVVPSNYTVKYIKNPGSFRQTTSQLATHMQNALGNARDSINRVQVGMERVPTQLRTTLLFLKHAPFELLLLIFPDSFNTIEKLVNDSLIVLQKPEKNFEEALSLIEEVDYLISRQLNNEVVSLQVRDLKDQWETLTKLINESAKRAETMRISFLLQFNWILNEFIRPNLTIADNSREFMIQLLLPKIIEIDQTCDLLEMVAKIYTDISMKYNDDQVGAYGHLLLLPTEVDRKKYLVQLRSALPAQVTYIARLALTRHGEYIQRDSTRRTNFEKFITDTSFDDLIDILGKMNLLKDSQ